MKTIELSKLRFNEIGIMENDYETRIFIKDVIKKLGGKVYEIDRVEEVVRLAQDQNLRAFILDIHMGDGREQEGLDALEILKKIDASIFVAILSAYPERFKQLALKANVNVFQSKSGNSMFDVYPIINKMLHQAKEEIDEAINNLDEYRTEFGPTMTQKLLYKDRSSEAREDRSNLAPPNQHKIFVLMPFARKFDEIYRLAIKAPLESLGFDCERADEIYFTGEVAEKIFVNIKRADFIIADVTDRNPNVFIEIGYAHALGKKIILLTQRADDIPFDLHTQKHIIYGKNKLKLKEELMKTIQVIIGQ